nr:DUF262 domain-containing protein [Nitrosomonas nitrosa]
MTNEEQSLSLEKIASWQISELPSPSLVAALPALQRGSVWRPRQIEDLWDSILMGYPIGAFLLASYKEDKGEQPFKHQRITNKPPTHHLLDGQQRATGIAIGFFDPWKIESKLDEVPSTLWIDIGQAPEQRDVAWLFRVVTRAHPWGYQRSDSTKTLSANQIRLALQAFKCATPALKNKRPSQLPLTHAWPWDADAPMPVAFLIHALRTSEGCEAAKVALWNRLQKLPLMSVTQQDAPDDNWIKQRKRLEETFTKDESDLANRLRYAMKILEDRLKRYAIPVTKLDAETTAIEIGTREEKKDPVEILFIRANRGGTILEGEELMYSLLKSSWIKAPKAIENLRHRLATPARIVLLCSRLVLVRANEERVTSPSTVGLLAPTPEVSQFRRYMSGFSKDVPDFQSRLERFIQEDGIGVFQDAYDVLTDGMYALPPVLASEIAQDSPDVFFLLLHWVCRMRANKLNPAHLPESVRRRMIGFLTALSWFAKDKRRAVAVVWKDLQKCRYEDLGRFFDSINLRKTCYLDNGDNLRMVPILPPGVLENVFKACILEHAEFSSADGAIWNSWNRWEWLIDHKRRPSDVDDAMRPWLYESENNDQSHPKDQIRIAWQHFIDRLMNNRSMLLFAQRKQIKEWFSDFDPSLPEFMEDRNRPWDYDHIHPQNWLKGESGGMKHGLPRLIKEWHHSIGNLRAWPLEANRADGDNYPGFKLENVSREESLYPDLRNGLDKRGASFISENDWESYWKVCVPEGKNTHYLSDRTYHEARKALVTAILRRLVAIYREWYDTLHLSVAL